MHSDEMSYCVDQFLQEANVLQWKKNADYHPEHIAFLEIFRTASETGISVEQDLWAKIRKQYIALRNWVINGQVASEPPRSRMVDIAVYMGMLAFWEKYKDRILKDALEYVEKMTSCENEPYPCTWDTPPSRVCDRCILHTWLDSNVNPTK